MANDASTNDMIISLLRYLKKKSKEVILSKINSGSPIPNNEFNIILGSKANSAAPTSAIFSSKNFLHKT